MQAGDGYSGQFLKDLATDIRAVEDKKQGGDPDVWDLSGRFSGKDDGWFANDPLDGVLGIMAKDPGTATSYLDPGPDGKNDNLTYLLTERDWNHVDTTRWQGKVQVTGEDTFDQDVRAGLGLALAAGATGNVAGADGTEFGRHTAAQARVMHDTVNLLDYGHADGTFGEDKKEPRAPGRPTSCWPVTSTPPCARPSLRHLPTTHRMLWRPSTATLRAAAPARRTSTRMATTPRFRTAAAA
ncbi:DUF6571 family protein [Streptomyces sp. GD-15H]|uniref:DUF6571 family protein n=1 Tax=Streptomyces sp. GD-15H TaxID=3129112 RepID=UPI003248C739